MHHHFERRIRLEEVRHDRREKPLAEGHRRRHAQLAARLALQLRHGGLGRVQARDGALCLLGEHRARVGQRERPRGALKELHAELLFELLDVLRNARLRGELACRRRCEGSLLIHGHEEPRAQQTVCHPSYSRGGVDVRILGHAPASEITMPCITSTHFTGSGLVHSIRPYHPASLPACVSS